MDDTTETPPEPGLAGPDIPHQPAPQATSPHSIPLAPLPAPASSKSGLMLSALLVSIVAVVLGAVGLTFGLLQRSHLNQQGRLIVKLEHQQGVLRREMVAILPKLAGAARDVITCGDLQNMYLQSYYVDSNGNLQSDSIPLPQHCINR